MRRVKLFNERVDRLTGSALAVRMADPRYTLDYNKMVRREWISADGVTEDAVDAFVLNVRLLIQDYDGFSIRCLADDVYAAVTVPEGIRQRFFAQRCKWNDHRKRSSMFRHFSANRNLTNGELFDVLMYGGLAHANRGKLDMFYMLTTQGVYSSFVCASFLHSLGLFLSVVKAMKQSNLELLEHMEPPTRRFSGRRATAED